MRSGMAVKYYKFNDDFGDSPIGDNVTYLEVDRGGALRQIAWNGKEYLASNVNYPPWGLVLAEGYVDYDAEEDVTPITKQEFDEIWQAHLATRNGIWEAIKQQYPSGTPVSGFIQIFFPQGAIVNLGSNDALGVADYQECKASIEPEYMGARQKITAVVKDYDEENQWIILSSPSVSSERVDANQPSSI